MKSGNRIEVEVLFDVIVKHHDYDNNCTATKTLPAGTYVIVLEDSLNEAITK